MHERYLAVAYYHISDKYLQEIYRGEFQDKRHTQNLAQGLPSNIEYPDNQSRQYQSL